MNDTDKTDAENKANTDEIKQVDATQERPRGNVHSEPDEQVPGEAPPPLAH